jgi:hypothetical protein
MEVDQPVVQDSRKQEPYTQSARRSHSATPDKCGVLKEIKQAGTGNGQLRARASQPSQSTTQAV